MNSLEAYLSSDLDSDSSNLKIILKNYIKSDENLQKVLEELDALKVDKLKTYKAIDRADNTRISDVDLKKIKKYKQLSRKLLITKVHFYIMNL